MFRFTIRDVLWLTVVVAVPLGYWAWFQQRVETRNRDVNRQSAKPASPGDTAGLPSSAEGRVDVRPR
jgi:hypothetical protein